jgi:hypothetical protein
MNGSRYRPSNCPGKSSRRKHERQPNNSQDPGDYLIAALRNNVSAHIRNGRRLYVSLAHSESSVYKAVDQDSHHFQVPACFYHAALPLSRQTLGY